MPTPAPTTKPPKKVLSRVDILNLRNDLAAHRLMNDKAATWGKFTKQFREPLLWPNVNEEQVLAEYEKILVATLTALRKYKPRKGKLLDVLELEARQT